MTRESVAAEFYKLAKMQEEQATAYLHKVSADITSGSLLRAYAQGQVEQSRRMLSEAIKLLNAVVADVPFYIQRDGTVRAEQVGFTKQTNQAKQEGMDL